MTEIKITRSYIYIVYECESTFNDGKVHGVYINRNEATGKKLKLEHKDSKSTMGHIAVLKKPLQGKSLRLLDL